MSRAEKLAQAKTAIEECRTKLTEKTQTDQSQLKLSGFATAIDSIKASGGGVELVVTAPDYEGETLTATKGEKQLTGVVTEGTCHIPVDEEGEWTVSADDGNSIKILTDLTIECNLSKAKTYGVRINEAESDPAKRVVYIGDAVGMQPVTVDKSTGKATYNGWDEKWVYDKVYPVMLSRQGEIAYKLNPDDYSKREDGGASDVGSQSFDGNAMVCIEKFYTKFSMDGQDEIIEICNQKKEGFEAIGFIREDGSEADRIFLPMFMGSYDSSNRLRSLSGQDVKYNVSWTDFRTAAQKNGTGYDIEYWAANQIVQALFFILMKSCNPKTAIADGRGYSAAKTGIMNNKGAIACDPSSKAVKFMHIEDFTSNYSSGMYRWEAGILAQSSKIFVKMKPPYSGTATSGYTQVSDHVQGSNYISRMKCSNSYGRYPIAYQGSDSTYETAYWNTSTGSGIYISRRGNRYGVAGRYLSSDASGTTGNVGAALSFVPPAQ